MLQRYTGQNEGRACVLGQGLEQGLIQSMNTIYSTLSRNNNSCSNALTISGNDSRLSSLSHSYKRENGTVHA